MAKRVISGDLFQESWIELDNEIRDLQLSFKSSGDDDAVKVK